MERLEQLRNQARQLTAKPGVYLMKNQKGEVIYVGKAKNLKNRVSSYFRNLASHNEKVLSMVSHVATFDFIVTDSEFEALVLECSLIKQYAPKYNILLKDDKGYHYISISQEDYPRITAVKQQPKTGEYLGPFMSSLSVRQAVDEANRVFRLPTCSRSFQKNTKRPCLNYYIQKCSGACMGKLSKKEYRETVDQAVAYLKNGSEDSIREMTAQMEEASAQMDFERAIQLRDRMAAIQKVAQGQKIYLEEEKNLDVIAAAQIDHDWVVAILKFRNGHMVDKDDYFFSGVLNPLTVRDDFIARYYTAVNLPPKVVLLDHMESDISVLADYLSQLSGFRVTLRVPQRGEGKRLVDMAMSNAVEQLACRVQKNGREIVALKELTQMLGLTKTPDYIEAYDISNLGDRGIVGGMVVFENGLPSRKNYRKFAMKEVVLRDDYASMREMLSRRFSRYQQEKEKQEGFGRLPDLILLDGGLGHLSVAKEVLKEQQLFIPCFGMIKDQRHRTRAIAADGGELSITSFQAAFSLITRIQDEVHRYTVSYQKTVRKKSMLELELTRVPGIGTKKASAILRKFKTRTELKHASAEELAKAAKVSPQKAEEILDFIIHLS